MWSDVVCVSQILEDLLLIMDVFSLEEDDGNGLFLTQRANPVDMDTYNFNVGEELLEFADISVSQGSGNYADSMVVEDISDDDFRIPSSTATPRKSGGR